MVLHRKRVLAFYAYAFDGMVVKVHMGDLHLVRLFDVFGYHAETVVLAGNLTPVRNDVFHRVVDASVPVETFGGAYPVGQRQELVPQAVADPWLVRSELLRVGTECVSACSFR